jgi:hypothetical protein
MIHNTPDDYPYPPCRPRWWVLVVAGLALLGIGFAIGVGR